MGVTKELYSPSDVKRERQRLYDLQEGVDPILNKLVSFADTTCDHDHLLQNTRGALHRQTNAFEGRVFNAYVRGLKWLTDLPLPVILRNLADYLEKDYSENPVHPAWIKRLSIDYGKLSTDKQKQVLCDMQIEAKSNATARREAFTKGLKSKQYTFEQIKELMK